MSKFLLVLVSATLLGGTQILAEEAGPLFKDPSASVEARVEDLLGRLTLEEKISMLGGTGFGTKEIPRLGIPSFGMTDASMGIRGKSTAYANGVGLASTWDADLAEKAGRALGSDCRAQGKNFLLGPGMNLYRAPMCGRNFEYLGEDPVLAGILASRFIQGLQSQQVAPTAKHFAMNEQELDRNNLSSDVDERTMRELYLKPFEIMVKNGALGVMSSYNPINNVHASQNDWLLNQVLKKEWGFKGMVMSDWNSCYDAEGMANGGLDLEMPHGSNFTTNKLLPLISAGKVLPATLDDKIRRQLRVAFTLGWFDRPQQIKSIPVDNPASCAVALQEAREAVTLLKNEKALLPLDPSKVKKVVLLGHNADPAVYGGAGSSIVAPFHTVSVYQGVATLLGSEATVKRVPWKRAGIPDPTPTPPNAPRSKPHITALDANGAEGTPPIPAEYIDDVKTADAVIVCVGFAQSPPSYTEGSPEVFDHEGEGNDRPYTLPPGQAELIRAAAELNPKTIVILNAGGSVATEDWIGKAPALLHAYYPGQEGGTAIAEILFGKTNPSGKLPLSWEKKWEDSAAYGNYPVNKKEGRVNNYKEGVFLGYRWFDSKKIEPLFPFGFGLSYTSFAYSDLKIVPGKDGNYTASLVVKNTGQREGSEVVQLYVQPPAAPVPRPLRELKGFTRLELTPGESKTITMTFDSQGLAYWDPASKQWTATPGQYVVAVGTSSAKLILQAPLEIQ